MCETQKLIQRLFIEATAACGDDPLAIERYIHAKLETMTPEEQRIFNGVGERISAFKYDDKPPEEPH